MSEDSPAVEQLKKEIRDAEVSNRAREGGKNENKKSN